MKITQMPSPNYWPGRDGHVPRWIILHGTAGFEKAQDCAVWFASRASSVSSHHVVGRDEDEDIFQCCAEVDTAWTNGVVTGPPGRGGDGVHHDAWWDNAPLVQGRPNPNLVSITIEHIKPSEDNSDLITEPQKRASFQLIREICERWNIPKRAADSNGGITGHFSMDPVNRRRCPGPYPWEELWSFLRGDDDMMNIDHPFAARHFEDRGGNPPRWHCKTTGCDIIGAILDYWRRTGGAFRLPRSNEIYGILPGNASFQVFEGGVLVYDPQGRYDNPGLGPVYAMHLDADTPGLHRLIALASISISPNIIEASRLIEEAMEKAKLAKEALGLS